MTDNSLEQRIKDWASTPGKEDVGKRLLEQLARIRKEFKGSVAERLESLVEETLERQINLEEYKKVSEAALKEITKGTVELIESAKKTRDSLAALEKSLRDPIDKKLN